MVSKRIKFLRQEHNMTQAQLARKLGITRASINAWEMGLSVPSTQYIIELSKLFKVSTDYILGLNNNISIDISDLSDEDVELIEKMTNHFRKKKNS